MAAFCRTPLRRFKAAPGNRGGFWGFAGTRWLRFSAGLDYIPGMYAKAIVGGKLLRFRLSPELARAHRANAGKTMSEEQVVEFVESRRRSLALRRAKPYLASRS